MHVSISVFESKKGDFHRNQLHCDYIYTPRCTHRRREKILWWGPSLKSAPGKVSHSNRHHTINGQLSTANHLSNLIINHMWAVKCGMTITLPPVCIIQDDDNPSLITSQNYCATWNVNNNYHVSSPTETCKTDCGTLKHPRNNHVASRVHVQVSVSC